MTNPNPTTLIKIMNLDSENDERQYNAHYQQPNAMHNLFQ